MENLNPAQKPEREGFSLGKAGFYFEILRGRTRNADALLEKFTDFDVDKLRELTGKQIKSLLIDIDSCIAPAYGEILPENVEKIKELIAKGVQIGVYSNCNMTERLKPLTDLGIRIYEGVHPKPMAEGFLEACEEFGFDPASTWMIGDNPATDGGAVGVLEGMALVKAIEQNNDVLKWKKRLSLVLQKSLRALALLITRAGNKKLIGSEDLRIS